MFDCAEGVFGWGRKVCGMTNTTRFNQEFTASPRLIRAINTAAWAHRDHVRKGTDIPYISHIFGVMHLVSEVTDDEDVLIAALFHDILEDVPEELSLIHISEPTRRS